MSMQKIRGFIAAIVALLLGIIVISFALAAFDIRPPIIGAIPAMFGL